MREDDEGDWGVSMTWPTGRIPSSALSVARLDDHTIRVAFRNESSGLTVTSADLDNSLGPLWGPWQDVTAPSPAGSEPAIVTVPGVGSIVYLRGNDNRLIARLIT